MTEAALGDSLDQVYTVVHQERVTYTPPGGEPITLGTWNEEVSPFESTPRTKVGLVGGWGGWWGGGGRPPATLGGGGGGSGAATGWAQSEYHVHATEVVSSTPRFLPGMPFPMPAMQACALSRPC